MTHVSDQKPRAGLSSTACLAFSDRTRSFVQTVCDKTCICPRGISGFFVTRVAQQGHGDLTNDTLRVRTNSPGLESQKENPEITKCEAAFSKNARARALFEPWGWMWTRMGGKSSRGSPQASMRPTTMARHPWRLRLVLRRSC